MKSIVCISDMHGYLPQIPECDLLLIGGDICPAINHDQQFQQHWLNETFRRWLDNVPAKKIVGIAGNHDFVFQEVPKDKLKPYMWRWFYIENETIEVDGLKIYGTPWSPWFWDWAFNAPPNRSEPFLDEMYKDIPNGVDIVISHGPPANCGDIDLVSFDVPSPNAVTHVGSTALWKHLNRAKPKLVCCGHIHDGRRHSPVQVEYIDSQNALRLRCGTVVNACYIDERYVPSYPPLVFDWERLVKGYDPSDPNFEDARDERYKR